MTTTQEIWLYVAILGVLSPFVTYALATQNLFFTLLESGNIKYIYHGDTLWKVIADVKGKRVEGHTLVPGTENRQWWEKWLGIYWVGIPPFASVRRFKLTPRKEQEELAGKPMEEWIEEKPPIEVDSLRAAFPRPFLLPDAELKDRQTVHVLVVGKFVVVNTYIPVPELKGKFFELLSSTLQGAVVDILKGLDMDAFKDAPKGEGGILEVLTKDPSDPAGAFNRALEKRVGLHLVGATIPQWDPSDKSVRAAMNKAFMAEKDREATLVQADAYRQRVAIETEADAKRIADLGTARKTQVEALVTAIASTGAEKADVVKSVTRVLEMDAAAGRESKLTTLVAGGEAIPVVPVGGDKSK